MLIRSPNAEDPVQRECAVQGEQDQMPQNKIGQVKHVAHSANNAATAAASSAASSTAAHSRHTHSAATPAATPAAAVVGAALPPFSSSASTARVPSAVAVAAPSLDAAAAHPMAPSQTAQSRAPHSSMLIHSPKAEISAQREPIAKQGESDLLAQKKAGQASRTPATATTVAPSSVSPPACANSPSSPQCAVCARTFHSLTDLHSHLASRSHADLEAAYRRGAATMSDFAFVYCRTALLYYPAPAPPQKELDPEQQEFADRCARVLSREHTAAAPPHLSLLALSNSLAAASDHQQAKRFLHAMQEGLRGLYDHLLQNGEDMNAIADEFDYEDELLEQEEEYEEEEAEAGVFF